MKKKKGRLCGKMKGSKVMCEHICTGTQYDQAQESGVMKRSQGGYEWKGEYTYEVKEGKSRGQRYKCKRGMKARRQEVMREGRRPCKGEELMQATRSGQNRRKER